MSADASTEDFLAVLEAHKGILYKVAQSYCRDAEDRKDLLQEIVIQLWKSFGHYRADFRHSTWIYRISLNVAISFYRKAKSRAQLSGPWSDSILTMAEEQEPGPQEAHLRYLQQCITELKELDKAILLLYLEARSYQEIAGIMGLSETNVSTRLSRIKAALKQKFSLLSQE